MKQIVLTGTGGQGLILAGIILAEAAVLDGKQAIQTQSYGPEARGGASKAEVLIADEAIDYPKVQKADTVLSMSQEAFNKYSAAAGEGVNVFFDNTGGTILDTAIRHMAVGGRIVQCGTVAISSWSDSPQGPRNEREMLVRRLLWGGFVIFDHQPRFEEAAAQLARWYLDGKLSCDVDLSTGIDSAPGSIESLYAGRNDGKKVIDISAA